MALSSTAGNISTQEGSGAVVTQANGATIVFSPGSIVTFSLQSTSGIGQWALEFEAPGYPALHQKKFEWRPGMVNGFAIPMPDYPVGGAVDNSILQGITLYSTVSDSSGGAIPQSVYSFRSLSSTGATVQTLKARAVILSALSAYTNTNGTIVENSNGAFATTDGLTIAVGDRVFLPPGIAAANADVGVYQVTSLGGASALWSMTRVADMPQGSLIGTGSEIHVTEGTVMAGTQWVLATTGAITIGTTTQAWYPRTVTQSITLAAGTKTIQNVPIQSTSTSNCILVRTATGGTVTSTIQYCPTVAGANGFTAGALGTGQVVVQATVAAGTIASSDTSILAATITNAV